MYYFAVHGDNYQDCVSKVEEEARAFYGDDFGGFEITECNRVVIEDVMLAESSALHTSYYITEARAWPE